MFKYSRYNNIIQVTNKYSLLYNTYTDKYLLLSSFLKGEISQPVDILEKKSPAFYKQLVESGCLVDESDDESLKLMKRILKIDEDPTSYQLTVNPTINCNFRCWYCYEEHRKTKMSPVILEAVKKNISEKVNNVEIKNFNLSFFGGEPLLYYWEIVLPLLEHLNQSKKARADLTTFVHFTSNGYLLNDQMIVSLKEQQVQSFQITLDGMRDEHDQTRFPHKGGKSFDKIVQNVFRLLENGIQVTLRLNYTTKNVQRMKEVVPLLSGLSEDAKNILVVDFQQVWQDRESNNEDVQAYIEECMDLLSVQQIKATHKCYDLVRNSCYGNKKNAVVINYDGCIYKCTARDFKSENSEGYLSSDGKIVWNSERYELRRNIRFSRPQCHQCRIAPICGGGCSQKQIERQNCVQSCLLGYDEKTKDEILLNKFYIDIVKPNL